MEMQSSDELQDSHEHGEALVSNYVWALSCPLYEEFQVVKGGTVEVLHVVGQWPDLPLPRVLSMGEAHGFH